MTGPIVEIVVVAYNCRGLLRSCLASIDASPPRAGRVLVHAVDNASTDGTPKMLRDHFSAVRVHELGHNAGFSAANNVALAEVTAPFVLVLNPDTELRPGVLDHLLDLMVAEPDVGMVGCRLELPDGAFDHAAKREFPTPLSALAHFTRVGRRAGAPHALAGYRAPNVDEQGTGDVDAVNGAFMFVRRAAMEQVGLFDEGYWLYMEDLDWCHRFHDAGWRVVYDGRVTALHVKSGIAGSHRALRQNVAFHRGMGRFYRRYESGRHPLLDLVVYAGIGMKLAMSVASGLWTRRP